MNAHLDSAQLYDLLERDLPGRDVSPAPISRPEAQRHLAVCDECRAEFDFLQGSLAGFRAAATNLALAHTPTRRNFALPRARFFTIPRAAWASGLVTAAALLTISLSMHQPSAIKQPDQAVVAVPAETAQSDIQPGIQSDEALLNGIDKDLSTSVPTALEPLEASPAAQGTTGSQNN